MLPQTYALYQNVPNPFNPATTIGFDLPERANVRLSIYDVSGKLVRRLVDEEMGPGHKGVTWNGRDRAGREVASGVYFYKLTAAGVTQTRKMVITR